MTSSVLSILSIYFLSRVLSTSYDLDCRIFIHVLHHSSPLPLTKTGKLVMWNYFLFIDVKRHMQKFPCEFFDLQQRGGTTCFMGRFLLVSSGPCRRCVITGVITSDMKPQFGYTEIRHAFVCGASADCKVRA